ncbi:fructose-2,6-bisphosphatase TIGAR-like [Paramacrobiotus metropolitanus]|uniref:fructose-2,6-bisphosphatase TIGAR-like n=1 Tax=Paramacrobiotus metropolitanus TaxID=2943436 RepID=UPI002446187F|nr:fructose-2,6-bisphosphatase TIGAR-like [Paramacrobiotus metropolitanus]XP_055335579.1 fructose-2,6-bisphosphatase TIGAR-like [Paramacrobiotus metropolitanus]XP_055335580.1 fructose-2,6-bisphosphatase TIGAR-like [Paramacrobiotus metropolitanus]
MNNNPGSSHKPSVAVLQHAVTSRTQYEIPLHFGITFVRHGESTGNKLGVVQGHQDYPLSTLGLNQAQQLGINSVMNLRVSHIYSSDLQRAVKTAEILRSYLLHAPEIQYDKRLRERGFGSLEGLSLKQFRAELQKSGVHMTDLKPPGGESTADLRARVISFMEDLLTTLRAFDKERLKELAANPNAASPSYYSEYQVPSGRSNPGAPPSVNDPLGASVLIFTHGGFIREALLYLEQEYNFCVESQRHLLKAVSPNCGISTLTIKITEPKTTVNCMWLHRIYHVSDNSRPKLNQSMSIAALRARSQSASGGNRKQFNSSISMM